MQVFFGGKRRRERDERQRDRGKEMCSGVGAKGDGKGEKVRGGKLRSRKSCIVDIIVVDS